MADRLLLEYPTKVLLENGTDSLLLEDGTLLLAQEWRVWPKVVRADGKVLKATAQVIQIVAEGQVYATP